MNSQVDFPLSREAQRLKRSMMRQLIAVTARPDIISFAGGLPAPELLPVEAWSECSQRVLKDEGAKALQYGPPFPPLQAALAELMQARGVAVEPDQVFITSGCQQGLHIAGRLLMDADSAVVLDQYVFPGVRQAFGGFDRDLREVPTHVERGFDLDALEEATSPQRGPAPRAIINVPDFHNPLGTSLSEEARVRLVALARERNLALVEDDPYGLLRFSGEALLPLVGRAPERTIYLGSFSKLVAPALRTGWMIAPAGLTEESVDLESSAWIQRSLADFLHAGRLEPHLAQVRTTYRQRRDRMTTALETHFPASARFSRPQGGMFIWVELDDHYDTLALLPEVVEAGVAYIPGAAFSSEGGHNTMRLNFSNASPERIDEGMAILGQALRERMPA
jgi:2-aminoadipate transaminase